MSPLPRFDSAFASAPRFRSGLGETAPAVAGRRRALGIEGMSRGWLAGGFEL